MIPATTAQTRFYLLDHQLGGSARTLVKRIRVQGRVDVARLRLAVGSVVAAHPSLRTSLHLQSGRLVQCLHDGDDVPFDILRVPPRQVAEQADRVAAGAAATAFAHGEAPLCRISALVGEDTAELVLAVHHAVFDEMSTSLLLDAVVRAYADGQSEAASRDPVTDAALAPARRTELESFWAGNLAGAVSVELPGRRPVVTTRTVARVEVRLDTELVERVRDRRYDRGATPFALLIAAVGWTLSRLADQEEVVLGVVANRRTEQTDGVIGCLQNTVPVRLAAGDPSGTTGRLTDAGLEALLTALEYADLPIEAIIEAACEAGQPGLLAALCTEGAEVAPVELDGLRWSVEDESPSEGEFDLAIGLLQHVGGDLSLQLEYCRDAFDPRHVARIGRCVVRALDLLARPEDIRLGHEPLAPADVAEILATCSGRPLPVDREPLVPDQILRRCSESPDAIAVVAGDAVLTYGELDRRSARLAAALRAHSVGRGDRVGIGLAREPALVVAVLGIHRVGAAYVPLDPTFPADRIQSMASDAALAAIVADPDPVVGDRIPRIAWSTHDGDDPSAPSAPTGLAPSDAAYVLYTSGSTGAPKGVVVEHGNLRALLAGFDELVGPLPEAVVAGTSLSFDISVLELLWPLAHGRRLVLTDHRVLTPQSVPEGALYQCTPTMAGLLMRDPAGRTALQRVGTLLVGGEALPPDVAVALADLVPGRVINCYGPTETTVWSTTWVVQPGRPVTIGRPLPGERCHVVDRWGGLLPIGCAGRLFIAGDGVARGYHRRDDLTAQRFTALDHANEFRAYDTGDVAEWDEDGNLRYLGRRDAQLKILAHRVEAEEVEAILRGHGAVGDVVVVPTPAQDGLLCYLTRAAGGLANAGAPVPVEESLAVQLRALAGAALPTVLVPRAYRVVGGLPRTPNGKLDRRAVADWAGAEAVPRPADLRGSGVGAIRAVWERVLGHPVEHSHRTFFELGGTSADLLVVFAALCGHHRDLSIADLFRHCTLDALAARLDTGPADDPAGVVDRGSRLRAATAGFADAGRRGRQLAATREAL